MFAVSRRMTACDFLLLGSSVALLVVSLWPTQSDRQSLEIRTDDGHFQRYSVSVNDPRLEVIKVRLKRWRTPSTNRTLRTARWHRELAEYYCQQDLIAAQKQAMTDDAVAQVSFIESKAQTPLIAESSFWSELRQSAQQRIAREEQRIHAAHEAAVPPVVLGKVVHSVHSPFVFPTAFFVALATVVFASRRQRVRPPIVLACSLDHPTEPNDAKTICLRIPDSWVRIRQPAEVVMWRSLYAIVVGLAASCLVFASFR